MLIKKRPILFFCLLIFNLIQIQANDIIPLDIFEIDYMQYAEKNELDYHDGFLAFWGNVSFLKKQIAYQISFNYEDKQRVYLSFPYEKSVPLDIYLQLFADYLNYYKSDAVLIIPEITRSQYSITVRITLLMNRESAGENRTDCTGLVLSKIISISKGIETFDLEYNSYSTDFIADLKRSTHNASNVPDIYVLLKFLLSVHYDKSFRALTEFNLDDIAFNELYCDYGYIPKTLDIEIKAAEKKNYLWEQFFIYNPEYKDLYLSIQIDNKKLINDTYFIINNGDSIIKLNDLNSKKIKLKSNNFYKIELQSNFEQESNVKEIFSDIKIKIED